MKFGAYVTGGKDRPWWYGRRVRNGGPALIHPRWYTVRQGEARRSWEKAKPVSENMHWWRPDFGGQGTSQPAHVFSLLGVPLETLGNGSLLHPVNRVRQTADVLG